MLSLPCRLLQDLGFNEQREVYPVSHFFRFDMSHVSVLG